MTGTRNRLDLATTLTVTKGVGLHGNAKLNILPDGELLVGTSFNAGGLNSVASAQTIQQGNVAVTGNMGIGNGNHNTARYYANGGTLSVGGSLTLATAQSGRIGDGELTVNGATVTIGNNLTNGYGGGADGIGAKGTIHLLSGRLHVDGQVQNASPSAGIGEVYGTINVTGGEFSVIGNFANGVSASSEERARRTFPQLTISGADATFNVGGNYLSTSNAVLVAQLAGPSHTPVAVAGAINLDGTFRVTLAEGYRPFGGERWRIMVADNDDNGTESFNGWFHTVDLSEVAHYGSWKVKIIDSGVLELYLPRSSTLLYIR